MTRLAYCLPHPMASFLGFATSAVLTLELWQCRPEDWPWTEFGVEIARQSPESSSHFRPSKKLKPSRAFRASPTPQPEASGSASQEDRPLGAARVVSKRRRTGFGPGQGYSFCRTCMIYAQYTTSCLHCDMQQIMEFVTHPAQLLGMTEGYVSDLHTIT